MSFYPPSEMEHPDDYSFNGHIRLKNHDNLYLNLGKIMGKEREILFEKKPVTLWHFQLRNGFCTVYIHSDGYSLDIYDKNVPRLTAWKSNWGDNQKFIFLKPKKFSFIRHFETKKIGLNDLTGLTIDVIHPDCIPVEGYIKLHNPKYKDLYLNLEREDKETQDKETQDKETQDKDSKEDKMRQLSITNNKEQRWKLKYLGFSDNSKNKYKVKIITEDNKFSLDIYDGCRPELLAWKTNDNPNQVFILEKMEKILLISRPQGKIGLDNYLELYIEFTD